MSDEHNTDNCVSITPYCAVEYTIYGYYPSLGANAFFCAYFGIFTLINIVLMIKFRTWFYGALIVLGAAGETVGYVGRIMMHNNPWDTVGFQIQICTLIFSPSFLAAGLYLTLKHMARAVGPQYSLIKPILYPYIFIACDIFSLLLQAIGGGVASSASTDAGTTAGGNIMLAGIVFQVFTFLALYVLIALYALRLRRNRDTLSSDSVALLSSRNFKIFAWGMFVASFFIFVRCVYRIAELAGGWANEVMRDEIGYIVLDGVMCLVATLALTVCHPGFFFQYMVKPPKAVATETSLETGREKPTANSEESVTV